MAKDVQKKLVPRLRFPEFQAAPEWCVESIGELFDTMTGGTPDRSMEEYWNGTIPWITTSLVDFNIIHAAEEFITEAGLDNSSAKLFPEGTVLVALYGQGKTRGKVALLGIEAATNQACAAILPSDTITPVFTFLSLSSRYDEMRALSNSGGQENLSQGLIRELPLPYPKDIAEQQMIAECLASLDELIAAQRRKVEALKAHKNGLMQQLFPREGETLPRLRFSKFQNAGEWEMKRIDEQGDVLAGKALAVNAPGPLRPYLRTKNVLDGAIGLSDVLTMPMTDAEFSRFEILNGDVLLNEGQSLGLVGRASIYRGELGRRCAMQNQLIRFRAYPSTCPEFAEQAFRQCQKDGTFASIATQTTSVAHLGSSRFGALELAWPPKLTEQQHIASCLSSLDAQTAAETDKLAALKIHKQGLMQQLFPSPEGP